jgi:hypothetical protein
MNRHLIRTAEALILIAVCMIATERPALAYVDPGTGAIIWQSVLAFIAGAAFSFRRINSWFKNRKGRKID